MANSVFDSLSIPPNLVKHASMLSSNIHLLFAHGAGAGSQHPFMLSLASALNELGVHVWLFDFTYMAQAKLEGKRRPPPRLPILETEYLEAIAYVQSQIGRDSLWIGGKSMGGRVACHVLNTLTLTEADLNTNAPNSPNSPNSHSHSAPSVNGATVIGYPFHPVGKPDSLRLAVLQSATSPIFICQGERDTFGSRTEIATYQYPENVRVAYFADGDHSLKPRKASGKSQAEHILAAAKAINTVMTQPDNYDASI